MADVKERILARIDPDEVIGFAKELVKIPSYTTDETPVAEFLHRFLQAERLESRLQEVDPGRFQTIARLPGVGGRPSLMFDGHLDIDPIPGGWVRDPWTPTVENDRFHGAGIYNMKGGDAAMVMAVVAARRAGVRLRGDVWLAGVVEELQGGRGHRPLAPERRSCRHGDRPRALQHPEHHHQAHRCRRVPGPRDRPVGPHLSHGARGERDRSRRPRGPGAGAAPPSRRARPGPAGPVAALRGQHRRWAGPPVGAAGPEYRPRLLLRVHRRALPGRADPGVDPGGRAGHPRRRRGERPRLPLRDRMASPAGAPVHAGGHDPALDAHRPPDRPDSCRQRAGRAGGVHPTIGAVAPYSYAGNDTSHLYGAGMPCCLYGPGGGFDVGRDDRWTAVEQIITCTRVFGGVIADICA